MDPGRDWRQDTRVLSWLDQEDGEQDVLRNGRGWNRGTGSPGIGQHEARRSGRNDDAKTQDGARHRDGKCLGGLTGLFLL